MHRPTSHLAHCALSSAARRSKTGSFRWPMFVMATSAEAGFCCCSPSFFPSKWSSNVTSFCTWFWGHVSFLQGLFIFLWPLLETHNCLPCLDYYVWLGTPSEMLIPVRYERFLQWQQNRSKATMWLLYKNSSYLRVPKTLLLDWRLYVACYYPTTPTDYPSTTRGTSVGPPVAVNIDFYGYLRFLSIGFVWLLWVQYVTDRLSGQERKFAV